MDKDRISKRKLSVRNEANWKNFGAVTHALSSFLGNLLGFVFLAPFAIYFALIFLLSFVGPVVLFVLLLWEWSFIGERNLLLSEQFETEGRIFQKMTELSFSTDVTTQSVVLRSSDLQ